MSRMGPEISRYYLQYLISDGNKKDYAGLIGAASTHFAIWMTVLFSALHLIGANMAPAPKVYIESIGPFFLIASILNEYGTYTPPVLFIFLKWWKIPIQGIEKLAHILRLLRNR